MSTAPGLYFAYGSNLSGDDWRAWCARNGCDPSILCGVGPAYLPDQELRFTRFSQTRQGGVLDVVPRVGQLTDGWLFEVRAQTGWQALDKKEGAPSGYARTEGVVLTRDGQQHAAAYYRVRRPLPFVQPTESYLALVRTARVALGLSLDALDAAAQQRPAPWYLRRLFVYGTLMRGESRHVAVRRMGARDIRPASTRGTLVDFGEWPGLIPDQAGALVAGECVEPEAPESMLPVLDRIEGFAGWGSPRSVFRRALVDTSEGLAWAWLPTGTDSASVVPSGDWRAHTLHLRGPRRAHEGGS